MLKILFATLIVFSLFLVGPLIAQDSIDITKRNHGDEPLQDSTLSDVSKVDDQVLGKDIQLEIFDRGEDQTIEYERVGEEPVAVFYRRDSGGKIMDKEDAIGVEVRLFEFE